MPRRTIKQAEAALATASMRMSAGEYEAAKQALEAARQQAKQRADALLDSRAAAYESERKRAFDALVELRERREQLAEQLKSGQLDGYEYARQRAALDGQRHRINETLERLESRVAELEEQEQDPIAYADTQHEKFPSTAPTFSF